MVRIDRDVRAAAQCFSAADDSAVEEGVSLAAGVGRQGARAMAASESRCALVCVCLLAM